MSDQSLQGKIQWNLVGEGMTDVPGYAKRIRQRFRDRVDHKGLKDHIMKFGESWFSANKANCISITGAGEYDINKMMDCLKKLSSQGIDNDILWVLSAFILGQIHQLKGVDKEAYLAEHEKLPKFGGFKRKSKSRTTHKSRKKSKRRKTYKRKYKKNKSKKRSRRR